MAVKQQPPITLESAPLAPATCDSEINRYGWRMETARAVMLKESGNNHNIENTDRSTGDYSIGCFQINLLGDNNMLAKYRDAKQLGYVGAYDRDSLKEWLKNPANNVAIAHKMYTNQGGTFCKSSGWLNTCRKLGLVR